MEQQQQQQEHQLIRDNVDYSIQSTTTINYLKEKYLKGELALKKIFGRYVTNVSLGRYDLNTNEIYI